MATPGHNINVPFLDDRISILNRNVVEPSPAKQIFMTVSAILALVRVSALVLRLSVNSL